MTINKSKYIAGLGELFELIAKNPELLKMRCATLY